MINESQRELLVEILEGHENLDKISINLNENTKACTIHIDELDYEDFKELSDLTE